MEHLILAGAVAIVLLLIGCIRGWTALTRVEDLERRVDELRREVQTLRARPATERPPVPQQPEPARPSEPAAPPCITAVTAPSATPSPLTAQTTPATAREARPPTTAVARIAAAQPPRPRPPEPGPPDLRQLEQLIGMRWMTWAGALAIFVAGAFLVRYAIVHGWLGPVARLACELAVGAALVAGGDLVIRRGMRPLGQGLLGCGLMVLYAALFAAFALGAQPLLGQGLTFALMAAVTASGVALALRHDALPVAILATLGGLLTPVLCANGGGSREGLFSYLLVLDLGVLAVAAARSWRALDLVAFAGTVLLFAGWAAEHYRVDERLGTLAWLAAFYLLFLILPLARHLRSGAALGVDRLGLSVANAIAGALGAWLMLGGDARSACATILVAMAAIYAGLGALARREASPAPAAGFIALAVSLVTIAVPVALDGAAMTVAWCVEAPVLLRVGLAFGSPPTQFYALVVGAVAVARALTCHWPTEGGAETPLWNGRFAAVMCAPAMLAAMAALARLARARVIEAAHPLIALGFLVAGAMTLVLTHAELDAWLDRHGRTLDLRICVGAAVWIIGASAYLVAAALTGSAGARRCAWGAAALAALLTCISYCDGYGDRDFLLNGRFALALASGAAMAWSIRGATRPEALLLAATALCWSFVLVTLETYGSFARLSHSRALAALSVAWAMHGTLLLLAGFRWRLRPLRFAGLGIFGLTAAKLVALDLPELGELQRIFAYLGVGVLMIAASWLYHRLERRVAEQERPEADATPEAAPPG